MGSAFFVLIVLVALSFAAVAIYRQKPWKTWTYTEVDRNGIPLPKKNAKKKPDFDSSLSDDEREREIALLQELWFESPKDN